MDPQLEAYRLKQRERAASAAAVASTGQRKSVWILAAGVVPIVSGILAMRSMRTEDVQGVCPTPVGVGACVEECTKDSCPQGMLCCSNGCGHVCMKPVDGKQAPPSRTCTLLAVLHDKSTKGNKAALEEKARAVLTGHPQPDRVTAMSALGIISLSYIAGREADCCKVYDELARMTAEIDSVEFDGRAPLACSPSLAHIARAKVEAASSSQDVNHDDSLAHVDVDVHAEDDTDGAEADATASTAFVGVTPPAPGHGRLVGAPSPAQQVSKEALKIWQDVLEHSPTYNNIDLKSLGEPVSVRTQVVAGINYFFTFADGRTITVWHQSWSGSPPKVTHVQ
eukprot:TRINITY_DN45022_c0_g1_i1.p1 TRINITY_DN45022_c0_g1~~TRINITY_DN45022_c0_g1_i1.p1  ORF type:complete len:338 (-),score=61.74 TRINITY_DN45022_c0_g1_i1:180-1193(-)